MSSAIPWLLLGSVPLLIASGAQAGTLSGGNKPTSGGPDKPPQPISIEDGLKWAEALPKNAGPEREAGILKAVKDGGANLGWAAIRSGPIAGYTATVLVTSRTLRIGRDRPVRVEVDYVTHQAICDHFGCVMMTPHVNDIIWQKAGLRLAYLQKQKWVLEGTMATTKNMIAYSQELDAGDGKQGRPPVPTNTDKLVSNESKIWAIGKRLWTDHLKPEKSWNPKKMTRPELCWALNYGWYQPNSVAVQSPGKDHNMVHTDYSQEWTAMHSVVILEGPQPFGAVHAVSILRHPVLCQLLSNEGPLPDCKHPFFGTTQAPSLPLDVAV